jgi:hypothetical protein
MIYNRCLRGLYALWQAVEKGHVPDGFCNLLRAPQRSRNEVSLAVAEKPVSAMQKTSMTTCARHAHNVHPQPNRIHPSREKARLTKPDRADLRESRRLWRRREFRQSFQQDEPGNLVRLGIRKPLRRARFAKV